MKIFSGLILGLLTTSAIAQFQHECPRVGDMLSRDYLGLSGDPISSSLSRNGSELIPSTASFKGTLQTRVFKAYKERHCNPKTVHYQERVCNDISIDLALGRGNSTFHGFFDLRVTPVRRAEAFASNVIYGKGRPSGERFMLADVVVKNLSRLAAERGMPRSWGEFTLMLNKLVEESLLSIHDFEDMTKINAESNRNRLGFMPLPGSQIEEGQGNSKLSRVFDLSLSSQVRAGLISRLLTGVRERTSLALSQSFVDFAGLNGIPRNWNGFLLMMNHSLSMNAISPVEVNRITVQHEDANRRSMGFEQRAFVCNMENRSRIVNVIEEVRTREFHQNATKDFSLQVTNAPLLNNEQERFTVSYNGLEDLRLELPSHYNSYRITEKNDTNGLETFKIEGSRLKVTPANSIYAEVLHQGKYINLKLQNTSFSALVGGKVIVEVEFFEKLALWKDNKLATKSFTLTDGALTAFTPNVVMKKSKRKAYIKVSMKVVGSPYFNENDTQIKEFEE